MARKVQAMGGRRSGLGLRLVPCVQAFTGAALGSGCASIGTYMPRPTAQQWWQLSSAAQVSDDGEDESTASSLGEVSALE